MTIFYQAYEISVESCDDLENCSRNVTFALMELSGSHYAAVCVEKDTSFRGETHSYNIKHKDLID